MQQTHVWTPSILGHGEKICKVCKITNREAAALDELDICRAGLTRKLTFEKLTEQNKSRCTKWQTQRWSIAEWTNALAGEAGEGCNIAKKLIRIRNNMVGNKEHEAKNALTIALVKEMADVVIYADLICTKLGFELGREVRKKFNEKSEENNFEERI